MKLIFLLMFLFNGKLLLAQDVKITKLKVSRPTENSFGPFVYNNTMYYCLDRGKRSTKKHENQDGRVFLDLFSIQFKAQDKTIGKPARLGDSLNTDLNEGPLEISKDGKQLFYSRNLQTIKDSTAENKLGIFISELKNGYWGIPQPYPFNNDSFNVAHPTLNNDATIMIFSSDKKSGLGGSDLYISLFRHGEWSSPENLGGVINTAYGESFPYLVGDETLYFTSNREGGVGGMDLYKSIKINGLWQAPKVLEAPINTKFDDFCYYLNEDGKSGYFSSNRDDNTDGIYYFEKKIPEPVSFVQQEIQFCYKITDSIIEESEDLEFTWDMGDGTKLKGLFVEHCYKDIGVYEARFSVYEKSLDRTYFPAASAIIVIDAKDLPVIEYEMKEGKYEFYINNQWSKIDYDNYYWEVEGVKLFKPKIVAKSDLNKIRLIVWNKKLSNSARGIELQLKK